MVAPCEVCDNCFNNDEKRPMVLQCGHTICQFCISGWMATGARTCPRCRLTFAVDPKVNWSLLEEVIKAKQLEDVEETQAQATAAAEAEHAAAAQALHAAAAAAERVASAEAERVASAKARRIALAEAERIAAAASEAARVAAAKAENAAAARVKRAADLRALAKQQETIRDNEAAGALAKSKALQAKKELAKKKHLKEVRKPTPTPAFGPSVTFSQPRPWSDEQKCSSRDPTPNLPASKSSAGTDEPIASTTQRAKSAPRLRSNPLEEACRPPRCSTATGGSLLYASGLLQPSTDAFNSPHESPISPPPHPLTRFSQQKSVSPSLVQPLASPSQQPLSSSPHQTVDREDDGSGSTPEKLPDVILVRSNSLTKLFKRMNMSSIPRVYDLQGKILQNISSKNPTIIAKCVTLRNGSIALLHRNCTLDITSTGVVLEGITVIQPDIMIDGYSVQVKKNGSVCMRGCVIHSGLCLTETSSVDAHDLRVLGCSSSGVRVLENSTFVGSNVKLIDCNGGFHVSDSVASLENCEFKGAGYGIRILGKSRLTGVGLKLAGSLFAFYASGKARMTLSGSVLRGSGEVVENASVILSCCSMHGDVRSSGINAKLQITKQPIEKGPSSKPDPVVAPSNNST